MTEPLSVTELMASLDQWAQQLDAASTRLSEALREFGGDWEEGGAWKPGPKILFEDKVAEQADAVWDRYEQEGKRPPGESIRDSRARKIVKDSEPQLWADYHRLKAETEGLIKWISSKKESISARQSVLSAEKSLLQPIGRA